MAQITYADKDKTAQDDIQNKWRDVDANEVKTVVNGLDSGKQNASAELAALAALAGTGLAEKTAPATWQLFMATLANILIKGNNAGGAQIKNVGIPTEAQDAATRQWVLDLVTSVGEFVGNHDASGGTLPATGSGLAGAIDKGDYWLISVAGNIPGLGDVGLGDVLFAKVAGADEATEFFVIPIGALAPDATPTVKGIAKLFDTYAPAAARTDGAVSEAVLLSAMRIQKVKETKTAHGFSVGDCLTFNPPTTQIIKWTASAQISDDVRRMIGIVSDIIDANNFLYVAPGSVIDTLSGLTPGQLYYVNHLDGTLISTPHDTFRRQEALIALTATSGIVVNGRPGTVHYYETSSSITFTNERHGFVKIITTIPLTASMSATKPGWSVEGFIAGPSTLEFLELGSDSITLHGSNSLKVPPGSFFKLFFNGVTAGPVTNWDLFVQLPTYIQESTGASIRFDAPRKYGTVASPISGNLTLDSDGLIPGTVQLIIHNDSAEPTYPTEFKKAAGSGNYVNGVNNFIYAHCVESGIIIYTITQIP